MCGRFFYISILLLPIIMHAAESAKLKASFAWSSRQGLRPKMEDKVFVTMPFNNSSHQALLGVCDGNDGVGAAEYVANNFSKAFERQLTGVDCNDSDAVKAAMNKTFAAQERELLDKKEEAGTTVSVAYLINGKLYCALVGDSSMALIRDGTAVFVTRDHRPDNQTEKDRVRDAGGIIKDNRVEVVGGASIAITRALGISSIKSAMKDVILAEPEIYCEVVQPNDCLIIASDGMWDSYVFKNDANAVAEFVKESLHKPAAELVETHPDNFRNISGLRYENNKIVSVNSPEPVDDNSTNDLQLYAALRALRNIAYGNGSSTDNITVLGGRFSL